MKKKSESQSIDEMYLLQITETLGQIILRKKIRSGKVDEELWDIFLALCECLEVNDQTKWDQGDPEIGMM